MVYIYKKKGPRFLVRMVWEMFCDKRETLAPEQFQQEWFTRVFASGRKFLRWCVKSFGLG